MTNCVNLITKTGKQSHLNAFALLKNVRLKGYNSTNSQPSPGFGAHGRMDHMVKLESMVNAALPAAEGIKYELL